MGNLSEKLWNYAEKKFQESGKTQFPTVRECAKAMNCRQSDIVRAIEDSELLMQTQWNIPHFDDKLGDHLVETFEKNS